MKHEFPKDFEFNPFLLGAGGGRTKEAIVRAAEYMDKNPKIQPKFEQVFNVILNADDETKTMTKEIFDDIGMKESPCSFFDDVCFPIYAKAVVTIKEHGWDEYIKAITK